MTNTSMTEPLDIEPIQKRYERLSRKYKKGVDKGFSHKTFDPFDAEERYLDGKALLDEVLRLRGALEIAYKNSEYWRDLLEGANQ